MDLSVMSRMIAEVLNPCMTNKPNYSFACVHAQIYTQLSIKRSYPEYHIKIDLHSDQYKIKNSNCRARAYTWVCYKLLN